MELITINKLYLKLALIINDDMYNDKYIDYYTYQIVEDELYKKIRKI